MLDDLNAQHLAQFYQSIGCANILPAWPGITAGMIVRKDHCAGIKRECPSEDQIWVQKQIVCGTLLHMFVRNKDTVAVQKQHLQSFMRQCTDACLQMAVQQGTTRVDP